MAGVTCWAARLLSVLSFAILVVAVVGGRAADLVGRVGIAGYCGCGWGRGKGGEDDFWPAAVRMASVIIQSTPTPCALIFSRKAARSHPVHLQPHLLFSSQVVLKGLHSAVKPSAHCLQQQDGFAKMPVCCPVAQCLTFAHCAGWRGSAGGCICNCWAASLHSVVQPPLSAFDCPHSRWPPRKRSPRCSHCTRRRPPPRSIWLAGWNRQCGPCI